MNSILLTVFVGFVLVNFFILLFLRYRQQAQSSSPERDSLLPFDAETTRADAPRSSLRRPSPAAPGMAP